MRRRPGTEQPPHEVFLRVRAARAVAVGIVPAKPTPPATDRTPAERHKAMTWAQRLAPVFKIDVTTCWRCGGPVRILARLTDPAVLEQILTARHGADLHGPASGPPRGELALG